MKTIDERFVQADKEAKWAFLLTIAYFIWWYSTAYGLAPKINADVSALPDLYFGLPLWFLLSCILGPIVFTVLCALMVKYLYQDMDLDVTKETEHE